MQIKSTELTDFMVDTECHSMKYIKSYLFYKLVLRLPEERGFGSKETIF